MRLSEYRHEVHSSRPSFQPGSKQTDIRQEDCVRHSLEGIEGVSSRRQSDREKINKGGFLRNCQRSVISAISG